MAESQKCINCVISKWVVGGGGGYFEQLWQELAIDKFTEDSTKENPTLATLLQEKCIVPYMM